MGPIKDISFEKWSEISVFTIVYFIPVFIIDFVHTRSNAVVACLATHAVLLIAETIPSTKIKFTRP